MIDVLRATTTICAALHHGARAVVPVDDAEEARTRWTLESSDAVLAGERECVRIPGFDLGNCPLEMHARGGGRTSRRDDAPPTGPRAFGAVRRAAQVYSSAAVNFTASWSRARALLEQAGDITRRLRRARGQLRSRRRLPPAASSARSRGAVASAGSTMPRWRACDLARHHGNRWDRVLRRAAPAGALIGLGSARTSAWRAAQDAFRCCPRDRRPASQEPREDAPCIFQHDPTIACRRHDRSLTSRPRSSTHRRRLGALAALGLGALPRAHADPVPAAPGQVGDFLRGGARGTRSASARSALPVLGIALALAGFDRLGALDMKRAALLISGLGAAGALPAWEPWAASRPRDLDDRVEHARAPRGLAAWILCRATCRTTSAWPAPSRSGSSRCRRSRWSTLAWHPLQRAGEAGEAPAPGAPGAALADEAPTGSRRWRSDWRSCRRRPGHAAVVGRR